VLIVGVGNTAMDCCRTARRIGGTEITVVARRSRPHFKASPWELEDAEEEGVAVLENHAPRRFVTEGGRLLGMELDRLRWTEDAGGRAASEVVETVFVPCDDVILAIGQENAFPWVERDAGVTFDGRDMPVVDRVTMESTLPGVFFGGDAAWGPQNIIWAVAHGHAAAISVHNHCQGIPVAERPPEGMNLLSAKLGMHAWRYSNDYDPAARAKMTHAELTSRFAALDVEVELGLHRGADGARGGALPELRRADALHRRVVHRVRRVRGRVPGELPDDHRPRRRGRAARAPVRAGREPRAADLPVRRAPADGAGDGEGRGRVPALRPVRRALPDGRVGHADVRAADAVRGARGAPPDPPDAPRAPPRRHRRLTMTAAQTPVAAGAAYGPAYDPLARPEPRAPRPAVNDFALKIGTVNGTGSASANGLLMQAIFRMGIPVTGKNIFPSNIQGLPTWYEIRVSKDGYTARPPAIDLVVALNPSTYARDAAAVRPGGYLLYDSSWPQDAALARDGVTVLGVPFGAMCAEAFTGDRERTLLRNVAYAGALAALLAIDMDVVDALMRETYGKKRALLDANVRALRMGYDYARERYPCPLPFHLERMDATAGHVLLDGNTACALGCVYAGATVGAWYPITPATSLMEAFKGFCQRWRVDAETGRNRYAILQARTSSRRRGSSSAPGGPGRARSRRRPGRGSR
jgi:Pyruvate/2-oxoacid:ferredoxin oxidoreductase gamma subunit